MGSKREGLTIQEKGRDMNNPLLAQMLSIAVSLGLLNVWLLRAQKSTAFRGGQSRTLKEEFLAYGLPKWFFYLTGALKVGSALILLTSLWFPQLAFPSAFLVACLMLGAVLMHLKVQDPPMKAVPAAGMLAMASAICILV